MILTKKQVQQRVLQNGKPLALNKFTWDGSKKTFSSKENNLVIDFSDIDNVTMTSGSCSVQIAGSGSTQIADWNSTQKAGYNSTMIRQGSIFEVIVTEKGTKHQFAPYYVKGYIKDGIYSETGKLSIIADGILSEIVSKKQKDDLTIYVVKNYNSEKQKFEDKESYLIKEEDIYSHGDTLEEAKEDLIYKISDRHTSKYKDYILDTIGQYGNWELIEFFKEEKNGK